MAIQDELVAYGLTKKEAAVYLATLELGESTVNAIARKAGIFRTYCYDILKSLSEQGLVSSIVKRSVTYYEAVDPRKFVELLKEKEERITDVLPQLQLLKGTVEHKPSTILFEGKEGIKSLHLDILQTGKDHVVLGSTTAIIENLGSWFEYYVKERVRKNICVRVLTDDTAFSRKRHRSADEELRTVRFWKRPLNTATYIYGSKIAMITYGRKVFGVIIDSEELANTQLQAFDALWEQATP